MIQAEELAKMNHNDNNEYTFKIDFTKNPRNGEELTIVLETLGPRTMAVKVNEDEPVIHTDIDKAILDNPIVQLKFFYENQIELILIVVNPFWKKKE